jgi:putative transcriptional regulator
MPKPSSTIFLLIFWQNLNTRWNMGKTADKEMEQFQSDLLESVRQMKAGKAARTRVVALTPAADARAKVGVSQSEFATLLGVSVRTLQDWEQGRREPSGAAKTLLRIAARTPEAVRLAV